MFANGPDSQYLRVAEKVAYEAAYGRVNPAIIRMDLDKHVLVVDLAAETKTSSRKLDGYLVVTYTTGLDGHGRGVAYASVDNHYVRKPSAYARFRNLRG